MERVCEDGDDIEALPTKQSCLWAGLIPTTYSNLLQLV